MCFIDYKFLEEANRVSDNARRDQKNKQKFFSKNVSNKFNNIIFWYLMVTVSIEANFWGDFFILIVYIFLLYVGKETKK